MRVKIAPTFIVYQLPPLLSIWQNFHLWHHIIVILQIIQFSQSSSTQDFTLEKLKENYLGKVVERESYEFQPGERREYHMISRGIIANEVVRRVDPKV